MNKQLLLAAGAALTAVSLTAGAALAQNARAYLPTAYPSAPARQAWIDALRVGNDAVYANPDFGVNPRIAIPYNVNEGFSGSSMPPASAVPLTGTENFPPGANGAEPAGAVANGSMMGGAG
jgi:hypothetical protein